MRVLRGLVPVLFLAMFLTACVPATEEGRAKVKCPACDAEIDALFQKRF